MSFRATVLKRHSLALLFLTLIVSFAHGQTQDAPINFVVRDAIITSFVTAPNLGSTGDAGGGGSRSNNQWLKVEFHYGTTANLKTRFLPSAEFKVWIEGVDPDAENKTQASGKGVAIALTASVTYVNIEAGKDVYGVFYVNPATLSRFSSRPDEYDKKFNIHLEAYVDGKQVDFFDKNKEKNLDWFKPLVATPGYVYNHDQCCFISVDPDKYPPIKLVAPAQ